jgi:hypothetical protein
MHENTTHTTPQLCHSRRMDILLGWHARNMYLCIAFTCDMRGLGNFVWETSDTRSFLHTHATREVHQHNTI